MKHHVRIGTFILGWLVGCLSAFAQYSINWFTVVGGGGTSTGVGFTVSGTMGQPDAGVMTGGGFRLQGGFWGVIATEQTQPICTSPPSGLVSWWRAEGNAHDSQGGNHGTLTTGVTYVAGKVGQAFSFNATHAAVLVGNPPNLRLQNLTIEAWVRRFSTSQTSLDTVGGADFFSYGVNGYGFGVENDGRLVLTKKGVSDRQSATPLLIDLSWHHVAVTKNASAVIFYVDGVATAIPPYDPGFSFTTSAALGADSELRASFFGTIDELAIYNRALTATEIGAIFNAGSAGKCPLTIMSPQTAGADFSFSFMTASGQSYSVEQNGTLATSDWISTTNFTGDGQLFQFVTPLSNGPQRFFRVSQP